MSLTIGMRQCGGWTGDVARWCAWAAANGFDCVELTDDQVGGIAAAHDAGLRVSSVDLGGWSLWPRLLSIDDTQRRAAVAEAAEHLVRCAAAAGAPLCHLAVLIPADGSQSRQRSLDAARRSLAELAPVLEANAAFLGFEGWPGPGAIGCTPESLRALLSGLDGAPIGVNFDPSHLLRQGIDPLRFCAEFGDRIRHVHAKDCELLTERVYDYGTEIGSTAGGALPWGGTWWRYCIPGRGQVRWQALLQALTATGYDGCCSIELEDRDHNGSEAGEQSGFLQARSFLAGILDPPAEALASAVARQSQEPARGGR